MWIPKSRRGIELAVRIPCGILSPIFFFLSIYPLAWSDGRELTPFWGAAGIFGIFFLLTSFMVCGWYAFGKDWSYFRRGF